MELLHTYGKELVSLIVPFITWFLNVGVKAKAKLIWASPHSFTFLVPEPIRDAEGNILKTKQTVHTASIKVINAGRDTAHKVELVFNWQPQLLNLWPVRHFDHKTAEDGRHSIIFENLSPKEEIGLEIMSFNNELPDLLMVRSAECTAQRVPLMWIKHVPSWKIALAKLLLLTGLGATVYVAIALIQFLVLRTPMAA